MLTAGLVVAGVIAGVALVATALVFRSYAAVSRLSGVSPMPAGQGPRVSIVVAARNEALNVRTAVASFLGQDYHDVELIVVEDRSTDRTGAILDEMAAKTSRLRVVHITDLPPGWLGKNNALHAGADRATGDILLFVDGDIILERTSVSRAVAAMELGADHVTVSPQMELPDRLLQAVTAYFLTWGVVALRIWEVNDPRSSAFVGIGAFNMVRTKWYRDIGGHARIAMRPDDDLMLGKLLKHSGARQQVFFGRDQVAVEWYRTLGEATQGFRKNAYAALHYSFALFVGGISISLAVGVWPFAAVWLTTGATQAAYAFAMAALMLGFAKTASEQQMPLWLTLLYPIAALIQLGMLVLAVGRTIIAGGIEWRGTFYPLDQLRANKI
ncbi:MAG: glycosyltransferase family 2 protein [Gemmatimonadota bacterium]